MIHHAKYPLRMRPASRSLIKQWKGRGFSQLRKGDLLVYSRKSLVEMPEIIIAGGWAVPAFSTRRSSSNSIAELSLVRVLSDLISLLPLGEGSGMRAWNVNITVECLCESRFRSLSEICSRIFREDLGPARPGPHPTLSQRERALRTWSSSFNFSDPDIAGRFVVLVGDLSSQW